MKKNLLFVCLIILTILFTGCAGWGTGNQQTERERIVIVTDNSVSTIDLELFEKISGQNSAEGLSEKERAGIVYLAQKEKMLRDFFIEISDKWPETPFADLSAAEKNHMAVIKILLDKYGLVDQAGFDLPAGEFADKKIKNVFDNQILAGDPSVEASLTAALEIVELNIKDIEDHTFTTSRPDLRQSYNLLAQVTRNHMRGLWRALLGKNPAPKYEPKYIKAEQLKIIVDSAAEDIPSFRLNLE